MKKFFAFLLSMAMVLSMGFTTVFAGSNVAKIGDNEYATLQAAINAAASGDTITLMDAITEDVTISKDMTIDGAGNTYTGKMTLTSKKNITIKNVNFDGKGTSTYAVHNKGAYYITIEDCTATNYSYGFLQISSSNVQTTVKNVTVSNMNYGVKIDYSSGVVLENVKLDCAVAGVLNSNYGEKTITIKDSDISILGSWTRNDTTNSTFVFEGANSVGKFNINADLDTFKLVEGATVTAPQDITATTDVADLKVVYKNGMYMLSGEEEIAPEEPTIPVEVEKEPEFASVTAKILWNGKAADSVEVKLLKNDKKSDTATLKAGKYRTNNWRHTWKELDLDEDWDIDVVVPAGYECEIDEIDEYYFEITLTQVKAAAPEVEEENPNTGAC